MQTTKNANRNKIKQVWDNEQIVADVSGTDQFQAKCYIRGSSLTATYDYYYGAKADKTYYVKNAHGDVTNLVDNAGNISKTYHYDAFGVEKNIDNADTNAFRYCGEYFDKETGTIYLRARYYSPSIGRFISRDSYAGENEDPLSLNLYTYCQNNPIFGFDPTGHFSLKDAFNSYCQDWRDGIEILKDSGPVGSAFASYSEGVVDKGGAIMNSVAHPIDTVSTAWSDFKADPLKNNLVTQTFTGIGGFYTGLWNASSNGDWNSVAYSLGGATTNVAAVGVTCKLGAKVAGKVAPNGINFSFGGGGYALASGGTWESAIAISSSQVVSAGAVAGGTLAGANVMFASRNGGNFSKMGKPRGNMPGNNQVQNQQVRDALNEIGQYSEKNKQILHREISHQGYGYQDILDIAKELFGGE